MKLTCKQRRNLILVTGTILMALLFLAGFHHHPDDSDRVCWYCITVAGALLPMMVALLIPQPPVPSCHAETVQTPPWFLWITRHRRGPPAMLSS